MGGADVANVRTFVGLDAHAGQTQGAAIDRGTGEIGYRRVNGAPREALAYLGSLPAPVLATYESGPVGYGLARAAEGRAEIEVRVCAPGSIPRRNDRANHNPAVPTLSGRHGTQRDRARRGFAGLAKRPRGNRPRRWRPIPDREPRDESTVMS
jgi:hypothetical protein